MTLGTPLAFAAVLDLGGATRFGYRPDGIGWLLAAIASGLPDIDLPPSKVGRLFWFVSVPLERQFGHRTVTHSFMSGYRGNVKPKPNRSSSSWIGCGSISATRVGHWQWTMCSGTTATAGRA